MINGLESVLGGRNVKPGWSAKAGIDRSCRGRPFHWSGADTEFLKSVVKVVSLVCRLQVWWKAPQVCFNLLNNACHKGSSPEFNYTSIWSNRITCSWVNHSRMRARCVDRHPPRAQWKRLGEKESNSMGAGTTRTMPAKNLWTPTRWFDKNNR